MGRHRFAASTLLRRRRTRVTAVIAAAVVLVGVAATAMADTTISSSGPLTDVTISSVLNCSVHHTGDNSGEFFADTACGTFVATGGNVYGPADVPAGPSNNFPANYFGYTPISQTPLSGAGTSASPYTTTTTVGLGNSGLTLVETDTYVVGQETYQTVIQLNNPGTAPANAVIYHGADCFLQDSDAGLGAVSGTSPTCNAMPGSFNPARIEGFFPISSGNNYVEDGFNVVWADIESGQPLPNTCRCSDEIDNGAAISWSVSLAAGGSVTKSLLTVFSPVGSTPVQFSKTADAASAAAGAADGYTVTVTNPGATAATLSQIVDTLPAGFSYVAGSTTGATTTDPTVSGSTLTWNATFLVPAQTGSTPGQLSLHFGVHVATASGVYTNSVTGSGDGVSVIPANAVAPITVGTVVTPLSIATTPSGPVPVGGTVSDSATVSGGTSPTGSVLFQLYGPSQTQCTGTPVASRTGLLSGGQASSGQVTVNAPGVYRWVATYSGDQQNDSIASPCGSETVTVFGVPTLTGQAYGLAATAWLSNQPVILLPPMSSTPFVSTTHSAVVHPQCGTVPAGATNIQLLCSRVTTIADARMSSADAGLLAATIAIPNWPMLPTIVVKLAVSASKTTCAGSLGDATISYLKVGTHVVINHPTSVAPNTLVNLGAVKIVMNEQLPFNVPDRGLRVNAVHVLVGNHTTAGVDVVIGSSESDIGNC